MPNMVTVGQRFVALISHLGISKNAFAASLDKTATVIQHLVDERNKPGFDLLCKIFEVYPNVSKEWLLQGVGPMLISEQGGVPASHVETGQAAADTVTTRAEPSIQVDEATLPKLPASATASPTEKIVLPSAPETAAVPLAAPLTAAETASTSAAVASSVLAAPADAGWQTALYTQQMAHQLALAEMRNQHLQEQQRLMQQMMDLMQRQIAR